MPGTGRRFPLRNAHLAALDLAAAAVVLAMLAPPMRTSVPVPSPGFTLPEPPGWAALIAWAVATGVAVPIVTRRRWPLPSLGVLVVASAAAGLLLNLRWPGTIATLAATALALYSVALTTRGRLCVMALASCLIVTSGAGALGAAVPPSVVGSEPPSVVPLADTLGQTAFGLLMLGAAWAVGVAVRQQREYTTSSAEQAARQALSDERHRIARELHDIVAHSMSLIAVKAGIANHVAAARPQEASEALRLIEATSRGALVDLRRLLGVLRDGTDTSLDLDPAPGLTGLTTLADRAASAGVKIELAIPAPLLDDAVPQGVQLSAYRIVQEALTNVVKHAGAVACRVAVTVDRDQICIEVTDDGRRARAAADAQRPGHGLVGMRERVATYGGTFDAGPRSDGGFAVHATLPYQPTAS